jgi:hypothetical protein
MRACCEAASSRASAEKQARTVVRPALDWLGQISTKLTLSLRGALARRSNLDRSNAQWPEIASLWLAMTFEVDGAT